jgi:hypothetical protein
MPIAWFLYGILELVRILLLGKEPTQNTVGAFMGFVPGVVVIIAWLVGYRDPSDHALWKFLALSGMGALVWLLLEHRMVDVNRMGFTNQFEDDSWVAEGSDHAASFVEKRT